MFYTSAASAASNKYHDWIHLVDEMSLCKVKVEVIGGSDVGSEPKAQWATVLRQEHTLRSNWCGGGNFELEKNIPINVGVKLDEST